ncbi:MAG: hypothetical protein U0998_08745 [Moraxellaceae bacterium]|nr:hypothetical protein [Moraxellaceae bacterium]
MATQLAMAGASMALLINILTRDGNAVARTSWIEQMYAKECEDLDKLSKELLSEIEANTAEDFEHGHRLRIFTDCHVVAFNNDVKANRQAAISDDERSILNTLAHHLKISQDEVAAIEHLSDPVKAGKEAVQSCLQSLREMGVVFINRKSAEVLIPDEVVSILNEIQHKELADKYTLRILRYLTDAELSNILKSYGKKMRGVTRTEKVNTILHAGIKVRNILSRDIFDAEDGLNQRKERLKELLSDLDIQAERLGITLDERIDIILDGLKSSSEREFNAISAASYKEMFDDLEKHYNLCFAEQGGERFLERLRREFELEDAEDINVERLKALSITPYDILYLLSNDELKVIRDSMSLPRKGNLRRVMIESYANANDKLIENFGLLARRDLAGLREAGIEITEAEIGVKFEEAAKTILEQLKLRVDEDLRKSINTAKDKADIIISISDDVVIVGEAKTCKNGDFAKYSTTSRQVKAYVSRCEAHGRRVAQVLIIAPSFSVDFVESAEMDTEVNISMLTADGLKMIHEAYQAKRNPKFSAQLLTKGGLLKAELIAKNL